MPDDKIDNPGTDKKETGSNVGKIVSSVAAVNVFEVTVKYNFGELVFYFLKSDGVTVFLSMIGESAKIEEIEAKKKGKKFYLGEEDNLLGEEIEVIEQDGDGVRVAFDQLDTRLRGIISNLSVLEIGLTKIAVRYVLEDCKE